MRILYLTHNVTWKGGGAFFRAYHQGRFLVQRGHKVTMLSISPDRKRGFEHRESAGVEIIESPDLLPGMARSGWDPWDTLQRILYLRQNDEFDLVHGLESRPVVAVPALYLKRTRGIPTILDWADWYGRGGTASERSRPVRLVMEPLETLCEELFHPMADGCVAMGEPLLERAVSVGVPRDRILNLLHGCDPEGLQVFDRDDARQRLNTLPRDGIVLGYLGVLRPNSAKLMFDAFRRIRGGVAGACKLVLVGNHKLKLADFLTPDIQDDVIETGWLSYEELNLYLAASDLLLLPFLRTTATDSIWPSKLNDYLAVGRPVVATEMRILQAVFREHKIGLLTKDTPEALADGCCALLADPALCREMGVNARALAEGPLSWDGLVDRLEQFYVQLISSVAASREDTPSAGKSEPA
jgi:glycosyltransferase involved in cell wall biosynthesis